LFSRAKDRQIIVSILLVSALATVLQQVAIVKAQNQATVIVLESVAGSTNPPPGTYNYNAGTGVTLTATPDTDFDFVTWLISTDASNDSTADNPYTLTVTGGVTYTISAVFGLLPTTPTFPNPPTTVDPSKYGFVSILSASGGHSQIVGRTQFAEGTYYFTEVWRLKVKAFADSGWQFSHWIISGDTNTTHGGYPFTLVPTDNPYTFDCGLGYTYAFQPVFYPTSTTPPTTSTGTGGISTELLIAIIAIIIAIVAVIASVAYVQRSKKK